jgi:hypothetical protein
MPVPLPPPLPQSNAFSARSCVCELRWHWLSGSSHLPTARSAPRARSHSLARMFSEPPYLCLPVGRSIAPTKGSSRNARFESLLLHKPNFEFESR